MDKELKDLIKSIDRSLDAIGIILGVIAMTQVFSCFAIN